MKQLAAIAVGTILLAAVLTGAYLLNNSSPTSKPVEQVAVPLPVPPAKVVIPAVPPQITALLKKAASGDAEAQYKLGKAYGEGDGIPQDVTESLRWYDESGENGYLKAQEYLAAHYYMLYSSHILDHTARDIDAHRSAYWYHQAAKQGDAAAMYSYGKMYSLGWGVPVDSREQYYWWCKAAALGEKYASMAVGDDICAPWYNNGLNQPATSN